MTTSKNADGSHQDNSIIISNSQQSLMTSDDQTSMKFIRIILKFEILSLVSTYMVA